MTEITGKYNTAVCYARTVEENAIEQIRALCDCEFTLGSQIRIMPDVHAGKGCTVGTTMTISDKACPNTVGVDIGCGMYTVKLREKDIDLAKLDEAAHAIPSGMRVWEGRSEKYDITGLRCYRSLKDAKRLVRSLGTLGGGNHFIEADCGEDSALYLVIHSGSRNLGKQVAELYQKLAVDLQRGRDDYFRQRDELIARYKAEGRRDEIQSALKTLPRFQPRPLEVPEEICWLFGEYLEDYIHDAEICRQFAARSREKMAEILMAYTGATPAEAFHTVHNYIDPRERILRKGAIAAHAGERVLIPINMRDGAVIAVGRGSAAWNYSAPHGAGRVMSRKTAKETISMDAYRKSMAGIYTTSVCEGTLDEAPMAYKSMEEILEVIRSSVDVTELLRPIYNFKAPGDELPWEKKG